MFGADFWKIIAIIKLIVEILLQVNQSDLEQLREVVKNNGKDGT